MRRHVIYTAGVFDLLHEGHLATLKASAAMGERLIVGVVSDDGTQAYKGRRPVQDERTRMHVVSSLRFVDAVLLQPGTDPTPCLELVRPDVMTHGADWERLREGQETLDRLGIEWRLTPYVEGISTTRIVQRVRAS